MTEPAAYPIPSDFAPVIDAQDWTGTQRPGETLTDFHARLELENQDGA